MSSKFRIAISRSGDAGRSSPPRTRNPPNSTHEVSNEAMNSVPQFINVTDSISLDKSSRTQVRVQVMRDYHRRRAEKLNKQDNTGPEPAHPARALTAKAQTQKFRLGGEKGLRPWVPVKAGGKRKEKKLSEVANIGRKKVGISSVSKYEPRLQQGSQGTLSFSSRRSQVADAEIEDGEVDFESFDHEFDHAAIDQWLSSLDFSLQAAILKNSPASGVLDPFAAMSLLITPRTQLLLHYYFNTRLKSSWLMMPMRKGLFSLAVHDAAMFHTFLTHYVASCNARFGVTDTTEGLYHRTMAIKLVNERLSDTSQPPGDGTIAAVANLAAYECSNGSIESVLVHRNGLEQLVNIRGGIHNGGFPPHVQRLLCWTDFHCANALLQKPRFPALEIPVTNDPAMSSPFSVSTTAWSAPIYQRATPDTSADEGRLGFILSGIRDLSKTLRTLRRKPTMPQEDIWYSDKIYYLQRQLYEIIHRPWDVGGSYDSACAIAALMYCGHCLRDIPFTFEVMAKSVTRLKIVMDTLEPIDRSNIGTESSERLFWAVAFGGIVSEGKPERAWFISRFKTSCDFLGLADWEKVRVLLETYLWQPELDAAGFRLWMEAIEGSSPHDA